jgi:hypothetical protein
VLNVCTISFKFGMLIRMPRLIIFIFIFIWLKRLKFLHLSGVKLHNFSEKCHAMCHNIRLPSQRQICPFFECHAMCQVVTSIR